MAIVTANTAFITVGNEFSNTVIAVNIVDTVVKVNKILYGYTISNVGENDSGNTVLSIGISNTVVKQLKQLYGYTAVAILNDSKPTTTFGWN